VKADDHSRQTRDHNRQSTEHSGQSDRAWRRPGGDPSPRPGSPECKPSEPLTSFRPPLATVTDQQVTDVPRAAQDADAVRYWTSRILTAPRPAGEVPLRHRNRGDHPEYADHATTLCDLRIAAAFAEGIPIDHVDRNGYHTVDYLAMQHAAATRMGISMYEYRRRAADGS
jgi:hypothetical protein